MKNYYIILSIVLLLFLQNCKKEVNSNAPIIKLVSVNPKVVTEYTDSIIFIVHYQDNNGDIGIPDADKKSIWLKDARLETADEYFLAPLAPLDKEVAIEGEFKIKLKNTFRIGTSPQEKTTFTIWIKDRQGNKSNEIVSPEIIINEE